MINIIKNTPDNIIFDFEYIEISYRVEIDLNKNKLQLYKNKKDSFNNNYWSIVNSLDSAYSQYHNTYFSIIITLLKTINKYNDVQYQVPRSLR